MHVFNHFGPFFALLQKIKTFEKWKSKLFTENQNFGKMTKASAEVIILHMCTKNHDHIMYASWDMECDRHNCHFEPFFPFFAPLMPKIKIWKKRKKKTYGDIIILHKCTINDNHMMYGSWDMECDRHNFFSFWTIFCPFTPPKNLENHNFEKTKKTPGDIIILHMCTINENHMMYGSWGYNSQWTVFWILGQFLPFDPPNNPKNKNFEKMKKRLEVLPFYTCVSQMTITWWMVP